jgi:3-oxoacyl-[acyl-carrier protein] reductase
VRPGPHDAEESTDRPGRGRGAALTTLPVGAPREGAPRKGDRARRAVVTGGGTGIGRAVAERLAAGGDAVVIVGRRADVLATAAAEIDAAVGDRRVTTAVADLTRPDEVERVAADIGADGVDVLVNNAGGNFGEADGSGLAGVAAAWEADFRGNVLTSVLLTQAPLPRLSRPGGRIVTISSIAGLRGAGSYGAAKAALHAWSAGLATALAPEGITVNVVAPGFVPDTEFWDGRRTEEIMASRLAQIPMGRGGTPAEVAAAVAHLASPDAGWTTGQILQVNGGTLLGRG